MQSREKFSGGEQIGRRNLTSHAGNVGGRLLFDQMRRFFDRRPNAQFDGDGRRVIIVVSVIREGHEIRRCGKQEHDSQHRPAKQSVKK